MIVQGRAKVAKFAKKHADSRKPLARFLEIAGNSVWPNFLAVQQSFSNTDYVPAQGILIFNIGGNKYRLLANVDFEEQMLYINSVLTHEDYDRENL